MACPITVTKFVGTVSLGLLTVCTRRFLASLPTGLDVLLPGNLLRIAGSAPRAFSMNEYALD